MSDIDEVKSRLSIVDIVGERVTIKKTGRNFKGLCPFHSEKTPSFIVSPDRQSFKCFGCGKGGSVIDFVMEYDHVDFGEALEMLADKAGVKLTRRTPETAEGKLRQKIYEVNHLASEFYAYLLAKHALGEKARLYLKNRGISDKSIQTFGLGYSPNSWDGLLKFLTKKGYDGELLETAGLVLRSTKPEARSSRFYDRFRGRVMFTLKDHRGQVVGFAGRVLDSGEGLAAARLPAGQDRKEAKYINTAETPVYVKGNVLYGLDVTRDAIAKANEAVVMEGELDVISSFQAGVANAVAIKGSALTEGHVRLLRRFAERLVFALDSDVAGDTAARRGIEIADSAGVDMHVVTLPSETYPDEPARDNPGLFKKAVKDAVPIYDYLLSSAFSRFDGESAYGKKKISDELIPAFAKIENPIVRGHYAKKLAKKLDVSEDAVLEGMEKSRAKKEMLPRFRNPVDTVSGESQTRGEKLAMHILALLLQGKTKEKFEELVAEIPLADLPHPAVRQVLTKLQSFMAAHATFLLKDFLDRMPIELAPTLDTALLADIADIVEDAESYEREWQHALMEAKQLILKAAIASLSGSLTTKTKKEDIEAVQEKLKTLSRELGSLEKARSI